MLNTELPVQPLNAEKKPLPRREAKCLLDSTESLALLASNGITLTAHQIAVFREIETTWLVDVFNPDTAGCLVNGRFDQIAANGYFYVLDEIRKLGRQATIEAIVLRMASMSPDGLAFVLFSAAKCMLYSDAIAHEAYRLLMLSKVDKRRQMPRAAIREYRDRIALADSTWKKAARSA